MTECMDILDINSLYHTQGMRNRVDFAENLIMSEQPKQTFKKQQRPPQPKVVVHKPPEQPKTQQVHYIKRPSSAKTYKDDNAYLKPQTQNYQMNKLALENKQVLQNSTKIRQISHTSLDASFIEEVKKQDTSNHVTTNRSERRSSYIKPSPKSTMVEIAYNDVLQYSMQFFQQIQKQKNTQSRKKMRKMSFSSISSTNSLDSSFEQMENRLRKNKKQAELTDQKYMISGFFELIKDHKKIILNFRNKMRILSNILAKTKYQEQKQLQPDKFNVEENLIIEVDNFFKEYSAQLNQNVKEFYSLQQSLQRLIRMNIHEPYLQRVKNKVKQVDRHKTVFEFIEVYLNAFEFLRRNAYTYFQEEEQITQELQLSPQDARFSEEFTKKIKEVRMDLESTVDSEEGRIISHIFGLKINKISEWHELVNRCLKFRYEFNCNYNLDNTCPSYKIIKSKKLYSIVLAEYKKIQQFLLVNFSMPDIYLHRLEQSLEEMKLMKNQALTWNQKLRSATKYQQLLTIISFNKKVKEANKQLTSFLQLKEQDDNQQEVITEFQIQSTDIIIQVQLWHQKIQPLLMQYYKSEDIKNDAYIQKIFNKSVILINYFEDLKNEIDQI